MTTATPARQPQECKTCIHDGKFEIQCCVMSGHYYNVCAISKIQVIEGKPIIRCSTHTSAPAPSTVVEDITFEGAAIVQAAKREAAKAERERVLSLMGDYLAEHIYTCRGISCVDSMKMAAYIGSLRHQQEVEQPKEQI